MIQRFFQRRKDRKAFISREIEVLRLLYGEGAYEEARKRQKTEPIYQLVRREIGRQEGRSHLDVATRYLRDSL